ncbi:Floral homeotic protein DEFICIENS [Morella rubra]|uniref:Floral homeotic protein DEFICIENS n=1 Tax=Morella rubra TaxID=262757 RepID=A0A6A1UXD4_9ROSI|nr:Floral homeotic protein DEFICIENS [Morella rubra]
MARGKIQIKRIENPINRQVTYSKRRKGLFKKAQELTVLCDVKVSIIMFSGNGRLHKYISPSTTTKQLIDEYQKTKGIDLWSAHYERMQENLKNLKEVNRGLRREIRQRSGESPNDLNLEELLGLEQDMESAAKVIRDRKYRKLYTQIETHKKKKKNAECIHGSLLHQINAIRNGSDPENGGGEYGPVLGRLNGDSCIVFRLQPNQPDCNSGMGSDLTTCFSRT